MQAKVQAVTIERTIEIIDKALHIFGKRVDDEDIQIESVQDFERFCRLKQFLEGKADSRVEHQHGVIPLAELQARFRGMQTQREKETLEMSGLLVDESAIDPGDNIPVPDPIEIEPQED